MTPARRAPRGVPRAADDPRGQHATGSLACDAVRRAARRSCRSTWMVTMQLREDELAWHASGEYIVVIDLAGSVELRLNESGRVLWQALAESATEPELVSVLVDTYGVEEQRAATDVAAFVADLRARKLVVD